MSTGKYAEIGMGSVVARAKLQLRLIDNSNDDFLEFLIGEALDHLDCSSELVKKICEIGVCDRTAKLPVGFVKFLGLRFNCDADFDTNTNPVDNQIFNRLRQIPMVYADTNFLNQCGCNTTGFTDFTNTFQINKGFIHFNFDPDVDSVTLAYLGLNVDSFGNTLVYQRYERALMNYACFMFAMAFKDDFTVYQIEMFRKTWTEQRAKLMGLDRMDEAENDKLEIAALMLTRLVPPTIYLRP